jgi:hypothetical protein
LNYYLRLSNISLYKKKKKMFIMDFLIWSDLSMLSAEKDFRGEERPKLAAREETESSDGISRELADLDMAAWKVL